MEDDLLPRLRDAIRRHALLSPGDAVLVGVSGGPDSLCLLHLLLRLAPELNVRLHVAHLNHGLRGADADADARFVAELAAAWGLPFTGGRADVAGLAAAPGRSLEEAARGARYAFLAQAAVAAGAATIAVGHNADDQAETVLMHFLRGSGTAGLRGMLPRAPLAGIHLTPAPGRGFPADLILIRPLLAIPRPAIEAYCASRGLAPRFDRSNADLTFHRNRLRHELLPLLAAYNPAIRDVLARTAEVLAGEHAVLQAALAQAWGAVALPAPPGEVRFDLAGWRRLPIGQQRATVREAIGRLRRGLRNIHWEHVERAVWLGREGAAGQSATLAAGLAAALSYDALRIADEAAAWVSAAPQVAAAQPLAAPGVTPIGGGWAAHVRLLDAAALPADFRDNRDPWRAWLDAGVVGPAPLLRPRLPGDRFQPLGLSGHSVKVNEFMINARTPRGDRAGWPLLVGQAGIAWLCGLRIDHRAAVRPAARAVWEVRLARPEP